MKCRISLTCWARLYDLAFFPSVVLRGRVIRPSGRGWWYPGEGVLTPRWPPPRRWINKPSYLRYEPLFTALSLWCTLRLSPTPLRLRSWARSRARFNGQAPLRLTKLSLPLSLCFVRERREDQPEGPNVKATHVSGVGSRIQPWGFSPPCHFIYFSVGEGGRAIFPKSLRVFRLLVASLCCDQLVVRPYLARARIGRR